MDRFEQRLKDDAARIRADVTPELRARIAASVRATERDGARGGRPVRARPLWWASSLTGIAAAILLIVFANRDAADRPAPPVQLPTARAVPEYVQQLQSNLVLRARNADAELATPLEDELDRLKADLEKARRNVERDVSFTF